MTQLARARELVEQGYSLSYASKQVGLTDKARYKLEKVDERWKQLRIRYWELTRFNRSQGGFRMHGG